MSSRRIGSRASTRPACSASEHEAMLDELFEAMVRACEEGRDPMDAAPEGVCGPGVEELASLAGSVAHRPSASDGAPEFEDFEIVRSLGRGGMGVVYLARQRSLNGRWVALKVLPPSFGRSPTMRARFRREAATIASLRHPHVVGVHAVASTSQGVTAYAMDFIDGMSLQELVESLRDTEPGPGLMERVRAELPALVGAEASYPRFVALVGRQMADALESVHESGLVHRDIKPSNILLRADGTPMLTDFGLVRDEAATVMTSAGAFAGTALYASPEQLRGDVGSMGPRSDVFSLGATLYHALALRPALSGGSPVALHAQLIEHRIDPLRVAAPSIPRDLEAIVMKAMDPEPARRYASAVDMRDDLDRFLGGRPTRARPIGMVHRAGMFARRNRRAVAWATASALIVAAIALGAAAKLVWLPGAADAAINRARWHLLDPTRTDQLFNYAVWAADTEAPSAHHIEGLGQARDAYESGLRLDDSRADAASELEVVRRMLGFFAGKGPGAGDVIGSYLGSARIVVETPPWERFAVDAGPLLANIPGMSDAELRHLGLAAFLVNDARNAITVWTALESRADTDAFVSGALGMVFLLTNEPARAYPRLHRAMLEYPDVGFFAQATADAAGRCGDLEMARRILEEARGDPRSDPLADFRITLLLDLAEGKPGVVDRYHAERARVPDGAWSPVVAYHVGERLLAMGRRDEAVPILAEATNGTMTPVWMRLFIPAFESWWADRDDAQRAAFCAALLDVEEIRVRVPWQRCAIRNYANASEWAGTPPEGEPGARAELIAIGARCNGPAAIFADDALGLVNALTDAQRGAFAEWILRGEGPCPAVPAAASSGR